MRLSINSRKTLHFTLILVLMALLSVDIMVGNQTADHVVISEIKIADSEFVELYNPTDSLTDMTGWYWCYYSSGRDWNDPYRIKDFPAGAAIPAHGFYLIATTAGEFPNADWNLDYGSHFLSNTDGSVGIFPWDPETKTPEEAQVGRIDAVGWGDVDYVFETKSAAVSGKGQSIAREPLYQDTDDNTEDFVVQDTPNPKNSSSFYKVSGDVSPQEQTGNLGEVLTYEVIVSNQGTEEDTYTLEVTNEYGWEIRLKEESLTISAGSSAETTLSVTIPPDAETGVTNTITVTITSQTDIGVHHSDSATVNVNQPPAADFTYSPSNPTTQDSIQFTDQSTDSDGAITSWDWDFGDGDTSTAQNPTHQYAGDGTYQVTLSVTDDYGATDSTSKDVTVANVPPSADADGPYSCTRLESVTLDGSGSTDPDGNIVSWEWNIDGHNASGERADFSCSGFEPGDYTVTLTVTDNNGATDTDTIALVVNNIPPIADFTYSPSSPTTQDSIQFTDQSTDSDGAIASWSWDFGDGDTSTAQNPTHQYVGDGNYAVALTVSDDDGATDTTTKQITIGEPLSSGDCNGDGVITMEDANLAAEFALGLETPTDAQKEAADVVKPFEVIDTRDACLIAEVAQGLRSGFE